MIQTKHCPSCDTEKPIEEFGKKTASKDGLQASCKVCRNAYASSWYAENSDTHKARTSVVNIRNRDETRIRIIEYLETHPCVGCGETDPVVLEFDHRDPSTKKHAIGEMLRRRLSWPRILEEIQKCDVRCANCHRRRTAKQVGSWRMLLEI